MLHFSHITSYPSDQRLSDVVALYIGCECRRFLVFSLLAKFVILTKLTVP